MTRPAIAALIFLIFGLLIVSGWWQPYAPDLPDRQPLVTQRPNLNLQLGAHRGARFDAPENTLAAIKAAIERGAAWVELDVRYTSDGVPVLFHDADVSRTTDGTGPLENYSLKDLQALDAGSWFNESFAGTPVPTLEEALKVSQGKVCIYWDAKGLPTQRAVELFQYYGFERGCLVVHAQSVLGKRGIDERAVVANGVHQDEPEPLPEWHHRLDGLDSQDGVEALDGRGRTRRGRCAGRDGRWFRRGLLARPGARRHRPSHR